MAKANLFIREISPDVLSFCQEQKNPVDFKEEGGGKRCLPERAERGEVADLRQVDGRPR